MKEQLLIPPLLDYFHRNGFVTYTEYRTPWAIPDILAVSPNESKVHQRILKGQLIPLTRELYWEIIRLIPDKEENRYIRINKISERTGLSVSYLETKILKLLKKNRYIEIHDDKCVKINGFHPYSNTLVSVEAKVKNWKKAGEQALRHQKFVNQAYVALPHKHIRPAIKNIGSFKKANIGLLEVDDENNMIIEHNRPNYHLPEMDTFYYVALDTLWATVQENIEQEKEEQINANSNSKSLPRPASVA